MGDPFNSVIGKKPHMPQPLSKVKPDASVNIGNNSDNPSDHRPQLSLLAMKVIAEWSILESFNNALFVKLLGANPAPGAAMYSSLSGGNAKRDALNAVAQVALTEEELEIFNAIIWLYQSAIKERNKVAHWVWGNSPNLLDAVLLCDPNILMEYQLKLEKFTRKIRDDHRHKLEMPEFPKDKIFVFYALDFTRMSENIQKLMELLSRPVNSA